MSPFPPFRCVKRNDFASDMFSCPHIPTNLHHRRRTSQRTCHVTTRSRWNEDTFGPHFSASPLEGIVAPLTETGIQVVFTPASVDDDIRREGILCMVEVRTTHTSVLFNFLPTYYKIHGVVLFRHYYCLHSGL